MKNIDRKGTMIETGSETDDSSLVEKLISAGKLISSSSLDRKGTIFIYLDKKEEEMFKEFYKKNLWIRRGPEPTSLDLIEGLNFLVSNLNSNCMNRFGKFSACWASEQKSDHGDCSHFYGWTYAPYSMEINLGEGRSISIRYSL